MIIIIMAMIFVPHGLAHERRVRDHHGVRGAGAELADDAALGADVDAQQIRRRRGIAVRCDERVVVDAVVVRVAQKRCVVGFFIIFVVDSIGSLLSCRCVFLGVFCVVVDDDAVPVIADQRATDVVGVEGVDEREGAHLQVEEGGRVGGARRGVRRRRR